MPALDLPSDLVSTDWLAAHLGDPGLVVVDATVIGAETPAGFRWLSGLDDHLIEGHIPGAVFADLLEEFSDPDGPYAFTRPDSARLEQAARALGIDDDVSVVVYDALSRSELQNGQRLPSVSSYTSPIQNADGSYDIYFGPTAPKERANWIQTVQDRGFFPIFRFYSPTEAFFDKSWTLDDIEPLA